MIIGGVDPKITSRNLKKFRRRSEAARRRHSSKKSAHVTQNADYINEIGNDVGSESENDMNDPNCC